MGIAEELVLLTRLPFPQVTLSLRKTRLHDTRTPIDIDFLGTLFVPVSFFCAPLEPPRTSSLLLCCHVRQIINFVEMTNFLIFVVKCFVRRGEKGRWVGRKALESWKNMRCENVKPKPFRGESPRVTRDG